MQGQPRTEKVIAALKDVAAKNGGRLTAEATVKAARARNHPLHGEFEWDDTKAGEAYRITQARALIRSVKVILLEPVTAIPRRVSVAVRDPDVNPTEEGYAFTDDLQQQPDAARRAMLLEFDRALGAIRRVRDLGHVFGFGDEIEALLAEAVALRAAAAAAAA